MGLKKAGNEAWVIDINGSDSLCCLVSRLSSFDVTCSFVMTLQLLSTVECGIPCLGEYFFKTDIAS